MLCGPGPPALCPGPSATATDSLELEPPHPHTTDRPPQTSTTACSCHPRGRPAGGQELGWLGSRKAPQKKGHLLLRSSDLGGEEGLARQRAQHRQRPEGRPPTTCSCYHRARRWDGSVPVACLTCSRSASCQGNGGPGHPGFKSFPDPSLIASGCSNSVQGQDLVWEPRSP